MIALIIVVRVAVAVVHVGEGLLSFLECLVHYVLFFGESKVANFEHLSFIYKNVSRLDVSMNKSSFMDMFETIHQLLEKGHRLLSIKHSVFVI